MKDVVMDRHIKYVESRFTSPWSKAPKMTRQHFNYIAAIIQQLDVSKKKRKQIAEKFAGALMRTNHSFKYHYFVEHATKES